MEMSGPSVTKNLSERGKNIFIAGLPSNFGHDDLKTLCAQYGVVTSAKVMIDLKTGKSKNFGFVLFGSCEEAAVSIQHLNLTTLPGEMYPLHATHSRFEEQNESPECERVYVRNLPSRVTSTQLEEIFAPYGKVEDVSVLGEHNRQGNNKGVGFVRFAVVEQAKAAIQGLDGTTPFGEAHPLLLRFMETPQDRVQRMKKRGHDQGVQSGFADATSNAAAAAAAAAAGSPPPFPFNNVPPGMQPPLFNPHMHHHHQHQYQHQYQQHSFATQRYQQQPQQQPFPHYPHHHQQRQHNQFHQQQPHQKHHHQHQQQQQQQAELLLQQQFQHQFHLHQHQQQQQFVLQPMSQQQQQQQGQAIIAPSGQQFLSQDSHGGLAYSQQQQGQQQPVVLHPASVVYQSLPGGEQFITSPASPGELQHVIQLPFADGSGQSQQVMFIPQQLPVQQEQQQQQQHIVNLPPHQQLHHHHHHHALAAAATAVHHVPLSSVAAFPQQQQPAATNPLQEISTTPTLSVSSSLPQQSTPLSLGSVSTQDSGGAFSSSNNNATSANQSNANTSPLPVSKDQQIIAGTGTNSGIVTPSDERTTTPQQQQGGGGSVARTASGGGGHDDEIPNNTPPSLVQLEQIPGTPPGPGMFPAAGDLFFEGTGLTPPILSAALLQLGAELNMCMQLPNGMAARLAEPSTHGVMQAKLHGVPVPGGPSGMTFQVQVYT